MAEKAVEDGVLNQASGGAATPERQKTTRLWKAIAAFSVAGTLAIGLVNALGSGTGPVFNLVSVLLLVVAFVGSVGKTLNEDFKSSTRPVRFAYVAALVAGTLVLLGAGLATRTLTPLPRMPGTADIATLGFSAPSEAEQQDYDDLSASLAQAIKPAKDGEVRNYAGDVAPPLGELRQVSGRNHLDQWLVDFLHQTDAEFVVGGYGEDLGGGQTSLHVLVYVPATMAVDAAELAGWYPLEPVLSDHRLDSARTRLALLEQVASELDGLASLLTALDAWQSGYADEAESLLGRLVEGAEEAHGSTTLDDLVRLFRGHALETASRSATKPQRLRMLTAARENYRAIPGDSLIAPRVQLSLATNQYLLALLHGCNPGSADADRLDRAAEVLAELGADEGLPLVTRRKAEVNQAQVELCRMTAGRPDARGKLDVLLSGLTSIPVTEDPARVEGAIERQAKALALSIKAVLLHDDGEVEEAIRTLEAALEWDSTFEQQATWRGLQGAWLLSMCRIEEGAAAQEQSLSQWRAAAKLRRIPEARVDTYVHAYAADRDQAQARCSSHD